MFTSASVSHASKCGRLLNHGYCKNLLVNTPVCLMEACVLKYLLNFDIVDFWNSRTLLGMGVSID